MRVIAKFVMALLFLATSSAGAGTIVYVPLGSGNQVVKIDAATDQILASYPGVKNPHGLVATPDGEYLVAGSLNEAPAKSGEDKDAPNSELAIIHPAHGHVMSVVPVTGMTHHQAITPDGRYVLSTHLTRGYVSVFDMQENKIVRTVKTDLSPNYPVVHPDGKYAYVTNTGSNNISEIDLSSWSVSRTFESGPGPHHMVLSKENGMLYVGNPGAGKVTAVSIDTGKIAKSWQLGNGLHGIDLDDDGITLFVSCKEDNKLVALNTKTDEVREINLSPAPYHLNTITGTGKFYVSSRKQSLIWVVDQKTLKVINEIKLPAGEGHQMAIVKNGD